MQLGMIRLGRMGANSARRRMQDGHDCVAFDVNADAQFADQLPSAMRKAFGATRSS